MDRAALLVVDTGGLIPDSDDSMDRAIRQQVEFALDEADLVSSSSMERKGSIRWTAPSPIGFVRRDDRWCSP